jgi:hypothetical protein
MWVAWTLKLGRRVAVRGLALTSSSLRRTGRIEGEMFGLGGPELLGSLPDNCVVPTVTTRNRPRKTSENIDFLPGRGDRGPPCYIDVHHYARLMADRREQRSPIRLRVPSPCQPIEILSRSGA